MLSPAQLRLHRWLAHRADMLIAVSSAGRERMLAFGVAPDRIALALQSGDVEPVRAAAAAVARAADGPRPLTVLSVGRLVPDKNFATLIEAFAQAGLTPDRAQLEIAGTGFVEPELRTLAERLGVPVRFHGAVPHAKMPSLYAAATDFALVSTYEPFGVAIREAVAAGLPIICTRTAGAAGDVAIEGRNAILVDPARGEDVAAALSRLLADESLRGRMGAEGLVDDGLHGSDVGACVGGIAAAARRGR
jgi:glycosyltransferase involved in cell wall biosynthesis